ncbi:MAG: major capsid protein [Bdellovibrionota bacterium]
MPPDVISGNPFTPDQYTCADLTKSINMFPNRYGRIRQLGIFPERGINTRHVAVYIDNNVLTLLPSRPLGSPGTRHEHGKATIKSFAIPHIPHDDSLKAADIQLMRPRPGEDYPGMYARVLARRLETMKAKHDQTLEYHRLGALKGIVLDADGSTLYNWFTEFGVSQTVVGFDLTNANTEVMLKCLAVRRAIETSLMGDTMTGVMGICGKGFFDKFTTHKSVKEAYQTHVKLLNGRQVNVLETDMRSGFFFGNILFEEYNASVDRINANGSKTSVAFVGDDDCHFFPLGTQETFDTVFAPADMIDFAGTEGLPAYASLEPMDHGRGTDIHTQSNPLAICYRPKVLVKGTVAA